MQPRSAAGPVPEQVDVVVPGGGLAGLCAARRLHQAGIAFCFGEARDRLGRRILTRGADSAEGQGGGGDPGPSWYWPGFQQGFAALVAELGLTGFAQHSAGDLVFDRSADARPERYPAIPTEPPSRRLSGGNGGTGGRLPAGLPAGALRRGCAATGLALAGDGGASVRARRHAGEGGGDLRLNCRQVIAALPPARWTITSALPRTCRPKPAACGR